MAKGVDRILEERRRDARKGTSKSYVVSVILHVVLAAAFLFLPTLFAKPQQPFEFVSVMVVTPQALGALETPPPPPPERPPPEPPPPEPPPPEPPPPEPESDVPVIQTKPQKKPPEPAPIARPPPIVQGEQRPPKREGSPQGSSLGASTSMATLGVEDPNFTYGYYLDRVIGAISRNWTRPLVGSEVKDAIFHFRIQRDGTIIELTLREGSGSQIFDTAARRAIESSSPLPPLPVGYKPASLGINLIVK